VLSDGLFAFREEPYRRPRLVLFHQRHTIYSARTLRKSKVRRFLESFISEELCEEREHGIIENDDISLQEWNDSLAVFESREVFIHSLGGKLRTRLPDRIAMKNLPNMLFGGGIGGNCRKSGAGASNGAADLTSFLLCPDCAAERQEAGQKTGQEANQPDLRKKSGFLQCQRCSASFPVLDGVTILLPTRLRQQLYPEIG
jgi:uncharacterized protein YbaR (Trm112 family)